MEGIEPIFLKSLDKNARISDKNTKIETKKSECDIKRSIRTSLFS